MNLDLAIARRRFLLIAAAAAGTSLAMLAGCARPSSDDALPDPGVQPVAFTRLTSDTGRTSAGDPAAARSSLTGFGADFLRAVRGADANTVISPYSLYTVLAMARLGAKGRTASQLDALLGSGGPDPQGAAITAIDAGLEQARGAARAAGSTLVVQAANEAWVQDGLPVHQEYLDELARQYGVSAVTAAFVTEPETIRADINDWVAERTGGLIAELFGEDSITVDTKVVLVNALYLKAEWALPFTRSGNGVFTTVAGSEVQVPMMHAPTQVEGTAGAGWVAVTVPYLGYGLRMTLLVPDPGRFDATLAALDDDLIAAASTSSARYELSMPPFKINSAPNVLEAVKSLGVVDLFVDGGADLSGIAGEPGWLFANAFVHQAKISVDENGTEAAAATGLGIMASGAFAPTERVVVDRPYLFWISETDTGAPLFLGAVTNPAA